MLVTSIAQEKHDKEQESSPFTTLGKSFEKNSILHGY